MAVPSGDRPPKVMRTGGPLGRWPPSRNLTRTAVRRVADSYKYPALSRPACPRGNPRSGRDARPARLPAAGDTQAEPE